MKKNPGRKDHRLKVRSNRRAAGRERAKENEKLQKLKALELQAKKKSPQRAAN